MTQDADSRFRWRLLTLVLVMLLVGVVLFLLYVLRSAPVGNELAVTFLNVGQGDAVFIETPDGVQVLIDGGPDGTVLRELGKVMGVFDRTIDVVVATHPDKDHIGGLNDVLARYRVGQIVMTENESDTAVSDSFVAAVGGEGAAVTYARAGQVWQLGASTTLIIYSPADNPKDLETNTASIVAQLRYGESEFLLTGDAPSSIEGYLVDAYGAVLMSDVLKLGHHGSRTSSAAAFLATVAPEYAVVSAGADNTYGHPHREVVERAGEVGAALLSTATEGRLTFVSNGETVWVKE